MKRRCLDYTPGCADSVEWQNSPVLRRTKGIQHIVGYQMLSNVIRHIISLADPSSGWFHHLQSVYFPGLTPWFQLEFLLGDVKKRGASVPRHRKLWSWEKRRVKNRTCKSAYGNSWRTIYKWWIRVVISHNSRLCNWYYGETSINCNFTQPWRVAHL